MSLRQLNDPSRVLKHSLEARKADLRRVEMELDEADEMVFAAHINEPLNWILMIVLGRFPKWILKFRESRIP